MIQPVDLPAAKEEVKSVVDSAGEQAEALAHETTHELSELVDEAKAQAREVSMRERDKLAGVIDSFNRELETMTRSGTDGYATQMARQVLGRTRTFQAALGRTDPDQAVSMVEGYARRRPGAFLGGALVTGFAVGRLVKARARSAHSRTAPTGSDSGSDGYRPATNERVLTTPMAARSVPTLEQPLENPANDLDGDIVAQEGDIDGL